MKKIKLKNNNKGFTIIETMISIGIFLVIVTIGMEALLNTSFIHSKSENQRSVIDNISFIMEDMSRNIRTGYHYNCTNSAGDTLPSLDCPLGDGIFLEPSDTSIGAKLIYYLDGQNNLLRRIDGEETQLNSSDIKFLDGSSFSIIGADPSDDLQPFVTIRLVGNITSPKGDVTPFSLQTSVSQRLIDIQQP